MQLALFLLTIQGIIFFIHYVVYKSVAVFFIPNHNVRMVWGTLMFILSLAFLAVSYVARTEAYASYSAIIANLYKWIVIYMSYLSYIFLSAIVVSIIYLFASWVIPGAAKPLSITLFALSIISSLALQTWGLLQAKEIRVTTYSARLKNIPESWNKQKIVFFADSHLGFIYGPERLREIVDLINNENPHIVFIVGDLYDGMPVNTVEVTNVLRELRSTNGAYFVGGNHEQYGDTFNYVNAVRESGVNVLDDEIVEVDGVEVIGLSYPTNLTNEKTKQTLQRIPRNKSLPGIVLKHVPNGIEAIAESGASLAFFGHSHNGQQVPWNFIADYLYKGFAYGKNRMNDTITFTTSGAGSWGPPQRIGSQNEIVVVTIEKVD